MEYRQTEKLKLPSIFGNHMVLQRGKPFAIWGWAKPKTKVEVHCEWKNNPHSAIASETGNWLIEFNEPLTGKGPYAISVKSEDEEINFEDVLIGDVWLCSGQSNMDMPTKDIENSEAELSDAEYNDIRLFRVSHSLSAEKALTDLNGEWMVCSSESARDFSAIGFLFSRELNSKLNTPVGMIQSAFGGTPIESWISLQALSENPLLNPILTTWEKWVEEYPEDPEERERITRQNEAEMKAMGKPIPPWRPMPKAPDHSHRPGSAFNAMINPLISYSIRGVLWYQGEANAPRARQYRDILPALIKNWRELWGNKDLPFLFVQLPRFEAEWLEDDIWAEIREAQSLTWRNMPETGMVVSMDRGDYLDLHPKDKKMIAIRLCLAALSVVYGENVEFSGPIYHSHKREGSNIRIFFEHTAGGLICEGKELQGFTIAGIDREFKPASAWIDNDNVLIKCDSNVPVAIRYRWANSPDGNLFNELGLPASPFRTDDWPGKTDDRVGDAIEKCVEMFL